MPITITRGGTTITPQLILGWESQRESQNVVHRVVNNPSGYVSLDSDGPSSGTLPLFFATRAAAFSAYNFLAGEGVYTLTDTDRPDTNMTFVRDGQMSIRQDDSRAVWYLDVGFRQVIL